MKNADKFFSVMKELNPAVLDFVDAISYAMSQTPKVNQDTYFGDIQNRGVYYANSFESMWFDRMTPEMAATILIGEML